MSIVIAICALLIIFAYEIRHRMVTEQLTNLENEIRRLSKEIKQLTEDLKKKQDAEIKKGFKLPFMP